MRFPPRPRQAPRPGTIAAMDGRLDLIVAETMRRAEQRLAAERASPARREAELAKTAEWLRQWRARAPVAVGRAKG